MLKIQKYLNYLRLNLKHKVLLKKYYVLKKPRFLPYEENNKRQLDNLNKLLNHANVHVPYYREIFKNLNIVIDGKIEFKDISELSKIPVLTKEIIRSEKKRMYSDDSNIRHAYRNTSGGSTGEPLKFIQDVKYSISNSANTHLALSWMGHEIYDDIVIIWGAPRDTFEGKKTFKAILTDFYHNRLVLNSFSMSNDDIIRYIQLLNKHQPKLIKAYAQSIFEIAKFAKKNGIYVKRQNSIHLAAGTVHDYMRKEIEEVFQCKAYNYYGSREVGSIASECCAQNGLHIMMDHTAVEVLNKDNKPSKDGEQGEIAVTTLSNYSMPLIRYKIGDIGVMQEYSECICGYNYQKLQKVVGRTTDVFKTISGSIVVPEYFIHLIGVVCNKGNIKLFQVIQEKLDKIIIKIVKDGEISNIDLLEIEEKIKLVMGSECEVIFEFIENIPTTLTGKYRYTISNI